MISKTLFFLLFASLLLGVNMVVAQGKLALFVSDFETSRPLANAKVELVLNGKVLQTAITNENGKFVLDVNDSRMMDVVISKQGFNKLMICEIQVKRKAYLVINGALTKGSQLQYYTHSALRKQKRKLKKTSRRAFANF